jgi:hypothetical protein
VNGSRSVTKPVAPGSATAARAAANREWEKIVWLDSMKHSLKLIFRKEKVPFLHYQCSSERLNAEQGGFFPLFK